MKTPRNPATALLAVAVLASLGMAQTQSIYANAGQVLIADGEPVPGVPGAVIGNTTSLDNPVMDLNGTMLFRGRFTGGGAINQIDDRGLFMGKTRETLQMIVRAGIAEPSGLLPPGTLLYATIGTLTGTGIGGSPRISPEGGYIMWGGQFTGPSIITSGTALTGRNDSCLYWGVPPAWQILARRADPAPGTAGALFETGFQGVSHQATALSSSGIACFQATLIGGDVVASTNNFATYTGTPGSLQIVQRKFDSVVMPTGTHWVVAVGFNCPINALGQVLHDERLGTTGTGPVGATNVTTANDSCVFLYTPGSGNALFVREGDPAPGMPVGALLGIPSIAQGFDVMGQTAIHSTMTGAVTAADDNAIFLGGIGTLQPVVREGDAAPGLPGVLIGTPNSTMSYSDYQNGSVAFFSTLTGAGVTVTNDQCLMLGRPGNLQIIAREGDPAPGFATVPGFISATFGDQDPLSAGVGTSGIVAGSVWLNKRGQIMCGSQIKVTVVTATGTTLYNGATYCWDPVTGLQLVHANGDSVALLVGPTPTFSSIGGLQFPSGDGTTLSLTNDGDFCHRGSLNPTGNFMIRGRMGSLTCGPSAVSATLGGVHPMNFDAGVANAGQIYVVIATGSGTRPGFAFGGGQIPLNPDAITTESINGLTFFPGIPWGTTLGVLDGSGRGSATFTMPSGFPTLAGIELDHAMAVVDLGLNLLFVTAPCGCQLY